jgi:energy-coupling factor transporter ATP-binding protein EcfA2
MRQTEEKPMIEQAVKTQRHLRIALYGPAGAGKTLPCLLMAGVMSKNKKIGVVDSENKKCVLCADKVPFKFDLINVSNNPSPEEYIKAMQDFYKAGYDCVIIDSASHEWKWIKDNVDNSGEKDARRAWNKITPRHENFHRS